MSWSIFDHLFCSLALQSVNFYLLTCLASLISVYNSVNSVWRLIFQMCQLNCKFNQKFFSIFVSYVLRGLQTILVIHAIYAAVNTTQRADWEDTKSIIAHTIRKKHRLCYAHTVIIQVDGLIWCDRTYDDISWTIWPKNQHTNIN